MISKQILSKSPPPPPQKLRMLLGLFRYVNVIPALTVEFIGVILHVQQLLGLNRDRKLCHFRC